MMKNRRNLGKFYVTYPLKLRILLKMLLMDPMASSNRSFPNGYPSVSIHQSYPSSFSILTIICDFSFEFPPFSWSMADSPVKSV